MVTHMLSSFPGSLHLLFFSAWNVLMFSQLVSFMVQDCNSIPFSSETFISISVSFCYLVIISPCFILFTFWRYCLYLYAWSSHLKQLQTPWENSLAFNFQNLEFPQICGGKVQFNLLMSERGKILQTLTGNSRWLGTWSGMRLWVCFSKWQKQNNGTESQWWAWTVTVLWEICENIGSGAQWIKMMTRPSQARGHLQRCRRRKWLAQGDGHQCGLEQEFTKASSERWACKGRLDKLGVGSQSQPQKVFSKMQKTNSASCISIKHNSSCSMLEE